MRMLPGARQGRPPPPNRFRRRRWAGGLVAGCAVVAILTLLSSGSSHVQRAQGGYVGLDSAPSTAATGPTAVLPAALSTLQLNTGAQPMVICAQNLTTCPAAIGESRVALTAVAAGGPTAYWPAVQVAFVIETTSYDGVLGTDRSDDLDKCAALSFTAPACEESNGVPFFVANAQLIANAIQQSNPHSAVSFAMVDYYDARGEAWDDTDGPEYNVDIGQFSPAADFGNLVTATFQQTELAGGWYNWDQDLDNNFLDSSSIAALYGAIVGSQLNWSNNAHHVVVWMGSSAPRDPSYQENYCVSPSEWNLWGNPPTCYSQTCEPSYLFATGPSPNCEGWIHSQDGNPRDSIAALAHNAAACTSSIGGVCTIDTIDLWTTTTDPLSPGWPDATKYTDRGGGPGGPAVQTNVARVLLAGCDMAAATGGTWTGPSYFTCPSGQAGTLHYSYFGSSIYTPNTNNPTLMEAFRNIGFGPVYGNVVARGSNQPMFQFLPFGSITIAPNPQWAAACSTPTGFLSSCQMTPTVLHANGITYYGWNWSKIPSENAMYLGDLWTVTFNVMATGPPYTTVPVDACLTTACKAAGSGSIAGFYTRAVYIPPANNTVINQSFPLALVTVELPSAVAPPPIAPPLVPPPIGGLPISVPAPVGIPAPLPVLAQVGITNVSVQATAAGFLGAGFMRVGMKNRPIAVKVAAKSGLQQSKFDVADSSTVGLGRFE